MSEEASKALTSSYIDPIPVFMPPAMAFMPLLDGLLVRVADKPDGGFAEFTGACIMVVLGIELDMGGKFIFGPILCIISKPIPLMPEKVEAELVVSGGLDRDREVGLQSMDKREREREIARQSIGTTLR